MTFELVNYSDRDDLERVAKLLLNVNYTINVEHKKNVSVIRTPRKNLTKEFYPHETVITNTREGIKIERKLLEQSKPMFENTCVVMPTYAKRLFYLLDMRTIAAALKYPPELIIYNGQILESSLDILLKTFEIGIGKRQLDLESKLHEVFIDISIQGLTPAIKAKAEQYKVEEGLGVILEKLNIVSEVLELE